MQAHQTYRKLEQLTTIIKENVSRLKPQCNDPVRNFERSSQLWRSYFHYGVCLSKKGMAESFIEMKNIESISNIQTFNRYQNDEKSILTEKLMKNFLLEEKAVSEGNIEELSASFCLGIHEGFTRVMRCIYHQGNNNGVFFPKGSHPPLVIAANNLKPKNYHVCLVDIHRDRGGKIALQDLQELVKKHQNYRTLCINLKTVDGAIYSEDELKDIMLFCRKQDIFLIVCITHNNFSLTQYNTNLDIYKLCKQLDFYELTVLYTISKEYNLGQAKFGLVLLHPNSRKLLPEKINNNLSQTLGTVSDFPSAVALRLITSPLESRTKYLAKFKKKYRLNMNLIIGYIEGVNSAKIDNDLREEIIKKISNNCQPGIQGLSIVYKPECGTQIKIDISALQDKYFVNIRMFNAEIFCYTLNIIASVSSLHSYQIMDTQCTSIILDYSVEENIHQGMVAIGNFIKLLSDKPSKNMFFPTSDLIENLIFPHRGNTVEKKEDTLLSKSQHGLFSPKIAIVSLPIFPQLKAKL